MTPEEAKRQQVQDAIDARRKMATLDQLPPAIRQAIHDAPYSITPSNALECFRVLGEAATLEEIAAMNFQGLKRSEQDRDNAQGVYKGLAPITKGTKE